MVLIKAGIFFALLVGLGWLVEYSAQTPGTVVFEWYGYEVETTVLFVAVCLLVLTLFFFAWGRVWGWFMAAPKMLQVYRDKKKEQKGFETFFKGLNALASGDAEKAKNLALQTSKLLPDQRLPHMIRAEAAQMLGEEGEAIYHFQALAEHKDSAFLGLRGLLSQAYKSKNYEAAYEYAQKAHKMKPKSTWVQRIYFEVLLHLNRFEEALHFLDKLDKQSVLSFEESRQHRAFISLQIGEAAKREKAYRKAFKYADISLKALPTFKAAGVFKASVYREKEDKKGEANCLAEIWQTAPKKGVFSRWLQMTDGQKNQLKLAQKLTKKHLHTAEGCMALGLAFMAAEKWKEAEQQFKNALEYTQNQFIYAQLLMCAERLHREPSLQEKWQKKAITEDGYMWEQEAYKKEYAKWLATYLVATAMSTKPVEQLT